MNTGSWDLDDLKQPPKKAWLESGGPVKALTYSGEPYRGKPTSIFAYYATPESVGQDGVPAMVLVHGGGGAAFEVWAKMWAERGYAALAMDLSGRDGQGERMEDGGPEQDEKSKFHDIALGVEEAWPYYTAAAVMRGVSMLASMPEVDEERIGITGISWGGYLTSLVIGLDDRLGCAVPVYGCGFLHNNSAWMPTFAGMPTDDRNLWVEIFDPSAYLSQAQMPILWINGTNDFAYPLDSYQLSYREPGSPRKLCVTVRMPHGHEPGWAPKEIGSCFKGGAAMPSISNLTKDGQSVSASFESAKPIVSAELCYTCDDAGWSEKHWESMVAAVESDRVTARLPQELPLAYFLTITDAEGMTISTEHEMGVGG